MKMILFCFVAILLLPFSALAEDSTGLKFTAAGDLDANFFSKNETSTPRDADVREVEFGMFGPVDQTFDANILLAAHNEDGAHNMELHEAFIGSSKLIPWSRFKVGRFFLGIGRLNQIHRHDWPFTSSPLIYTHFFDGEGVSDTGAEYSILLVPIPIYTDITMGITDGRNFGDPNSIGVRPNKSTHYMRIANYFPLGETGGMQTGLNYVGRDTPDLGRMDLFGIDATAKWKDANSMTLLLQSEIWSRLLKSSSSGLDRETGGYLYGQYRLYRSVSAGLRYDGFKTATGTTHPYDSEWTPILSYKNSEFATFRASYAWDFERNDNLAKLTNRVFQLQAVFILGAHPAHDF